MRYIVEQGQIDRVEAEDQLVRVLVREAVDEVDLGADGPRRAGGRLARCVSMMNSVEPSTSAACTTSSRHSGWTITVTSG